MIYLLLFWTFFKIGLFTIGGGYAMIPMIQSEVVAIGWLTEDQLLDFMAISESTPGPFAINMATFVGFNQAGILGALSSTIGVVLPSFIIILIVAKIVDKFLSNRYVKYALSGVRPVVVGLIVSVAVGLIYNGIKLDLSNIDFSSISYTSLGIMILTFILLRCKNKKLKKLNNPIVLILISAILGIILFGLCKFV